MQLFRKTENIAENIYENMPDQELFLMLRDDLLHSRTGIKLEAVLEKNDREKFRAEVTEYIRRIYRISDAKIQRFVTYIEQYIFKFHVLTEVMEAKDISDIKVLAWNNVRIKQLGQRKGTDIRFWSPEDFRGFVEMIAVKNGINMGKVNAIQTFTDKKSNQDFIYRFNISTDTINSTEEPYLHIRKIPKEKKSIQDLIEMNMLDRKMVEYLNLRRRKGYVIISGKNGSGKTYLLNALLDEIPAKESVMVVQENEELFSDVHPEMMFQHIAVRKGDKKMNFSLKELVINSLLVDIDHIVIGEIKGEEALYFITAALSGCNGMTTIHSTDAAGALDKLADYCKWASDYSRDEILKMLSCVKTVVYINNFKITEVVENHGWDEDTKQNRLEVVYDKIKGVNRL
ncbi:MAG: CpaF family protein [Lachnospiraceae bacterium]|nr:CpaF family protein [Lachnospiraceae bacterium]